MMRHLSPKVRQMPYFKEFFIFDVFQFETQRFLNKTQQE